MSINRIFFLFFYSIFILSFYFIGQLSLGSSNFTLLKATTIGMIMICIWEDKKILFDKYLFLYGVFWGIRLISSVYDNFFDDFVERFMRAIPMAYALYWSSIILVRKYEGLYALCLPLLVLGIFNAVVTIFQSLGYHNLDLLLAQFNNVNEEELEYIYSHGDRFGLSVSGICGTPVKNGHYSIIFLLSTFFLLRKSIWLWVVPFVTIITGVFFCQQRSAFVIVSAASLFLMYLHFRRSKYGYILSFLFVIAVSIVTPMVLEDLQLLDTRVTEINLNSRESLYSAAIHFIGEHPFLGGYEQYCHQFLKPPHNLLLSMFVAGGIIGGLILLSMIIAQYKIMWKQIKRYKDFTLIIFTSIYVALMVDSMFHNSGLVEGDPTTWLCWGILLGIFKSYKIKELKK